MEPTLQCMMNESSIDYMSKFADLVQEVSGNSDENKTWPFNAAVLL